jgi:hypothetical protein
MSSSSVPRRIVCSPCPHELMSQPKAQGRFYKCAISKCSSGDGATNSGYRVPLRFKVSQVGIALSDQPILGHTFASVSGVCSV